LTDICRKPGCSNPRSTDHGPEFPICDAHFATYVGGAIAHANHVTTSFVTAVAAMELDSHTEEPGSVVSQLEAAATPRKPYLGRTVIVERAGPLNWVSAEDFYLVHLSRAWREPWQPHDYPKPHDWLTPRRALTRWGATRLAKRSIKQFTVDIRRRRKMRSKGESAQRKGGALGPTSS
jgi:hypothetical protein